VQRPAANNAKCVHHGNTQPCRTSLFIGSGSNSATRIQAVVGSGLVAGQGCGLISAASVDGIYLAFSAEL